MLLSRLIFPRGSFFAGRARTRKLRGSPRAGQAWHTELGIPVRKLRRGCAAGKILDGKAFGGRCAGQKSWRGTHGKVVLLRFFHHDLEIYGSLQ